MIRGGLARITRCALSKPRQQLSAPAAAFQKSVNVQLPAMRRRYMSAKAEAATDDKAAAGEEPKAEEAKAESGTEASAEEAAAPEAELTEEETLQLRIEELEAAVKDSTEKWKRALADAENTRQMAQREIANSKKFAAQSFAKSMLDVCDNLALAIEHTPEDQRTGETNPPLKALFEGVQMTESILMSQLKKHGVEKFHPLNEPFDPNIMMALFEMPVPDKDAGTVAQVIKTGFMINDRVLRPADVGVVKKAD